MRILFLLFLLLKIHLLYLLLHLQIRLNLVLNEHIMDYKYSLVQLYN